MEDKRIAELEAQLKAIQEELEQAKKDKSEEAWKNGFRYWSIVSYGEVPSIPSTWENSTMDLKTKEMGNVFKNEQEAKDRLDLLRWLAADPDRWEKIKIWREMVECAGCVEGLRDLWIPWHSIDVTATTYYGYFGVPGFSTRKATEDCISKIGADRLKRYWFGVKE